MTSNILKLKVKSMRAYRELNEAAPFTQFDDMIGLIDIVAVEECERFLSEMKDIRTVYKASAIVEMKLIKEFPYADTMWQEMEEKRLQEIIDGTEDDE